MANSSVQRTLAKIVSWAESFPEGTIQLTVDDNPPANIGNYDYVVDYEIDISPVNPYSLSLTIWLSDDAIGFFVGGFKTAARLINSNTSCGLYGLSYAGTEPITGINDDMILHICDAVSNAKFEIIGSVVFGRLQTIYIKIEIERNRFLTYTIGQPLCLMKVLSRLGVAKKVKIPCHKW